MRRFTSISLVVLLACALTPAVTSASKIENVVVLMLENRAFDHMCGWLSEWLPKGTKFNGLTGKEFNVANGTKYTVEPTCPYVNPFDPDHSYDATFFEVMGDAKTAHNPEPMSGFAQHHFNDRDPKFWTVMHGFNPARVPAISTLATNFAVFDDYYSGLPGPTLPNRQFFLSGTSHGLTGGFGGDNVLNYIEGMPQKTIFDAVADEGLSFGVYFEDVPDVVMFKRMRTWKALQAYKTYDLFLQDAEKGTLPNFSWVTPRFYASGSKLARDQHPDHDVVQGEHIIAEVYAALRASPQWNTTALVITYDEHGGFYDHQPPPFGASVPNPDGITAKNGFNFDRLGVRVCQVVVSPWVPKGTIVRQPSEAGLSGHYEHSSMYATLKQLLGLKGELTNRTATAAPYTWIFNASTPRTDCPATVPVPTDYSQAGYHADVLKREQRRRPNDLQVELRDVVAAAMKGMGLETAELLARPAATQQAMGEQVRAMVEEILKHRQ